MQASGSSRGHKPADNINSKNLTRHVNNVAFQLWPRVNNLCLLARKLAFRRMTQPYEWCKNRGHADYSWLGLKNKDENDKAVVVGIN